MEIKPFEKRVLLASPTTHNNIEMKYVQEAYDTNWISTVGENINVVENSIAKRVGCKYAVGLSSGTSALHLAVRLAGVKQGDYVFCSDMTFIATVNPIVYEKAIPVFIDTEYDTWNMDPVALEKAFEKYPNVKVVVLAHLYGTPAKIDEIREVCKRHNATLVEDAAESFGATYKGKQTATFGEVAAISFNGNKIITGSTGGMLLTDDEEIAKEARKLSTQARDDAPWYQHTEYGYNYRMSNIVAGVIRGQLEYLDEHINKKREIYMRYKEGLKDLPIKMNPYDEVNSVPNFWLSCMIIDKDYMAKQVRTDNSASFEKESGKSTPTEILETLNKYNAEGRPIWKPMHKQPIYQNYPFVSVDNRDVSCDIFERGLCLPSDIKMTHEEQDIVIEIIKSCFR